MRGTCTTALLAGGFDPTINKITRKLLHSEILFLAGETKEKSHICAQGCRNKDFSEYT